MAKQEGFFGFNRRERNLVAAAVFIGSLTGALSAAAYEITSETANIPATNYGPTNHIKLLPNYILDSVDDATNQVPNHEGDLKCKDAPLFVCEPYPTNVKPSKDLKV